VWRVLGAREVLDLLLLYITAPWHLPHFFSKHLVQEPRSGVAVALEVVQAIMAFWLQVVQPLQQVVPQALCTTKGVSQTLRHLHPVRGVLLVL